MKNCEISVEGNELLIKVLLDKEYGASSSGKTTIVGSSEGSAKVPGYDNIKFTLSVYKK